MYSLVIRSKLAGKPLSFVPYGIYLHIDDQELKLEDFPIEKLNSYKPVQVTAQGTTFTSMSPTADEDFPGVAYHPDRQEWELIIEGEVVAAGMVSLADSQ